MKTRTVVVPDVKVRVVLATIRANGGFITKSSLVGNGHYQITFTKKR